MAHLHESIVRVEDEPQPQPQLHQLQVQQQQQLVPLPLASPPRSTISPLSPRPPDLDDAGEPQSSDTDEEIFTPATAAHDPSYADAHPHIKRESQTPLDLAVSNERLSPDPPRSKKGRPRIHPAPTSPRTPKVHQRSKTGCRTCRIRKKKCDEAKPECMNCVKNNLECKGYARKTEWLSGKLARTRGLEHKLPPRGPLSVFSGFMLDNELDMHFFQYFHERLSNLLTVHDEDPRYTNPFIRHMVTMAASHGGLMHSLLALSGTHLNLIDPNVEYQRNKTAHFEKAVRALLEDVKSAQEGGQNNAVAGNGDLPEPVVGCVILHCLIPIAEGSTDGQYRAHLDVARRKIRARRDHDFLQFAYEFCEYHCMAAAMTSLHHGPGISHYSSASQGDANPDHVPAYVMTGLQPSRNSVMIGICDGLHEHITRIAAIRDTLRARREALRAAQPQLSLNSPSALQHLLDYDVMVAATRLGRDLLQWQAGHQRDTPKWFAAELYRDTAFVYLHRTVRLSLPDPELAQRVDSGLTFLDFIPHEHSALSIMLLPVFLLACAAFAPLQRRRIEAAFDRLEAYSKLANISNARRVVHQVWRTMDAGSDASWDWEMIMFNMNIDMLVT